MLLVLIAAAAIGYLVGGLSGVAIVVLVAVLGFAVVNLAAAGNGAAYPKRETERLEEEQRRQEEMEQGHGHSCREGHHWTHTGPTALNCKIPVTDDSEVLYPEDCALCSGREELLIRLQHSHTCGSCDGEWTHEGKCIWMSGVLWCPWCHKDLTPKPEMKRGPHKHNCPQCFQEWKHVVPPVEEVMRIWYQAHSRYGTFWFINATKHQELVHHPCSAPHRARLPECPGCKDLAGVKHDGLYEVFSSFTDVYSNPTGDSNRTHIDEHTVVTAINQQGRWLEIRRPRGYVEKNSSIIALGVLKGEKGDESNLMTVA